MKPKILFFFVLFLLIEWMPQRVLGNRLFDPIEKNFVVIPNSDSSLIILQKKKVEAENSNRIQVQIECLLEEGSIYRERSNLNRSMESFYQALYLSNKINDRLLRIKCYEKLASMYLFFFRYNEAKNYANKAHQLTRQCVMEKIARPELLIKTYFLLSKLEQGKDNIKGLAYIDSCILVAKQAQQPETKSNYIHAQQALLYIKSGNINKAESLLFDMVDMYTQPSMDENAKKVLIFVYSHLNQVYRKREDYLNQIKYCKLSLKAIKSYNTHKAQKEYLYTQLSSAYSNLGDNKIALSYLWKARVLRNQIFGVRNNRNKNFFKLHSNYLKKIEKRDKELINSKLSLAQKEKTIVLLEGVFVSLLLLIAVIFLIVRMRIQKLKHQSAQLLIEQEAKEKEKSANQIIELKNKELTSYSLRFLERKDLLIQLSSYIRKHPEGHTSIKLLHALEKTTTTNWEEFNSRFSSVHEGFYDRLKEKYPNLSNTELKHCALIKLNFSAKEMSNLLSISPQSINVSRYRIRQKMELERTVNLNAFISNV